MHERPATTLKRAWRCAASVLAVAAMVGVIAPFRETGSGASAVPKHSGMTTNPFRTGRTLVIPHGGGDALYPENTLLAYERTIGMGADVVDVDLQLSRDNVVVAIHDGNTGRTTGHNA